MTESQIQDNITLGPYQIRMGKQYALEHVDVNGKFEIMTGKSDEHNDLVHVPK